MKRPRFKKGDYVTLKPEYAQRVGHLWKEKVGILHKESNSSIWKNSWLIYWPKMKKLSTETGETQDFGILWNTTYFNKANGIEIMKLKGQLKDSK